MPLRWSTRVARGQENQRNIAQAGLLAQRLKHAEAVQPRHLDVAKDHIGLHLRGHLQAEDAIRGRMHLVTRRFQIRFHPGPPAHIVLNNQDFQHLGRRLV
jgi:hypothetical protein